MKYAFMAHDGRQFRVAALCRVLRVSRSGYYRWRHSSEGLRAREDRKLLEQIRAVYEKSGGRYGSPRVYQELKEQGVRCSKHRVERLMRHAGLRARRRRNFRVTTRSTAGHSVAPNYLERQFCASDLNQIWAGDITYLETREGWLYLAVLLDLCSRRVVGWACSDRITRDLSLSALNQALHHRQPPRGLLHHSDRGSQYTCADYRAALARQGAKVSMSRRGDCYDNAVVESFFSTLKAELAGYGSYKTRRQAQDELFEYIEIFYNRQRKHSSLGYLSPVAFEKAQLERSSKSKGLGRDAAPAVNP
jgi:transposase InsO family protein